MSPLFSSSLYSKYMNVLIIDRNEAIRDFFSNEISQLNCLIYATFSLKRAYEMLSVASPDIIFCGGRVDDGDSLDFLKNVRKKFGNSILFYIVSAYSPYTEDEYLKAGANGFIDKTRGLDQVVQCVLNAKSRLETKSHLSFAFNYKLYIKNES